MEKSRVIREPRDEDLFRYKAAHAAMMYYGNRIKGATPTGSPVQPRSPLLSQRQQVHQHYQEKTFDPNIPHENSVRDRAPTQWTNTPQQQPYYSDLGRCFSSPGTDAFSYPSEHYFESPEMYHAYYSPYLTKQQMEARKIQMRRLDVSPVRYLPTKVQKPIPAYPNYMMTPPVFAPPPVYGHNAMPSSRFLPEYSDPYPMEIAKMTKYEEREEKIGSHRKDTIVERYPDDDEYYSGSAYGRSEYASSNPSSIIDEDNFRGIISEDQIVRESQCDETENVSIREDSLEQSVKHFEQKLSHSIINGDASPNIPMDILKQMRPKASSSFPEKLSKKLKQLMENHKYSQTDPLLKTNLTHLPSIDKYISTERVLGVDVEIQTGKEGKILMGELGRIKGVVGNAKDGVKSEGACSKWTDILQGVSNAKGVGKRGVYYTVQEVGNVNGEVSNLKRAVGFGEQRTDSIKRGKSFVKGELNIAKDRVSCENGEVGSVNNEVGNVNGEVSSVVVEEGSATEGKGSLSSVTVVLSAGKFSNETVIFQKNRDDKIVKERDVNVNTDWTGIGVIDSDLISDEIEICTMNTNYLDPSYSVTHLFQAAEKNEDDKMTNRQYSDEDNFMSYPGHENVNEGVEIKTSSGCERFAERQKLNYQRLSVKLSEFAYKFCKHSDVQSNALIQRDLDRYKRMPTNTREAQSLQGMVRLAHTLRLDPIMMLINFFNVMFSGRFSVLKCNIML